jgi:hypothetical protein
MQDHEKQVRELSDAELDAVAAGGGHAGAAAGGLDMADDKSGGRSRGREKAGTIVEDASGEDVLGGGSD